MFPTWAIVLLALVFLALVIFVGGGMIARRRHRYAAPEGFDRAVGEADRALAVAEAEDRGWRRATLEDAARRELAAARPGAPVRELTLVQVLDRPGTDEDRAVFEVVADERTRLTLTLGRRGGEWFAESLADAEAASGASGSPERGGVA